MRTRSRHGGGLQPLGLLLRKDVDLRVPPSIDASPVAFRDWEAAVGSRIAARARPVKIERGVLLVRTSTATWAQELSLLSETILEQLRARGVAVRSLRFRVGQVDPPERPPSRSEVRKTPPEAPLPQALREELARIDDDELRVAIAKAAAKNLGWQAVGRQAEPPTSTRPAVRGPRSAASESAPSARTPKPASAARRGKP